MCRELACRDHTTPRLSEVPHSESESGGGQGQIRRLAVEHVRGKLAVGDEVSAVRMEYPWLEPEVIQACLVETRRLIGHERLEQFPSSTTS